MFSCVGPPPPDAMLPTMNFFADGLAVHQVSAESLQLREKKGKEVGDKHGLTDVAEDAIGHDVEVVEMAMVVGTAEADFDFWVDWVGGCGIEEGKEEEHGEEGKV